MPSAPRKDPPDQAQRDLALDPRRSVLVRAPAGSGKTALLAKRFLSLLAEVDEPGQIVAITFTKAAAAEMRNRILDELRSGSPTPLVRRALERSADRDWNLLDLPAQLRIQTIDSFCRDLALQQPLLSGLGGSLDISDQADELYRRAARRTLQQIGQSNAALSEAIETLLEWRDNNWREIEDLTVEMLANRDRWMQGFVLESKEDWNEQDWKRLRDRLELPFRRAAESGVSGYTDAEWQIVRACFTLLRHAAAELKVVFAESASADYTEVAQIALNVLQGEDGLPTDAAAAVADGIRHLLVDEFQDTSRRQHELLRRLIAAWPDREGRTCFVVGDPMQSIYFFREADAELFPRVEQLGLEIRGDLPLVFDPIHLTANFRSAAALVRSINEAFALIFAGDDGSGIRFTQAEAARDDTGQTSIHLVAQPFPLLQLHVDFIPESARGAGPELKKQIAAEREAALEKQIDEIVGIIRSHQPRMEAVRAENEKTDAIEEKKKYRVAVLARARKSLEPIASALRDAGIPFRAVELERLGDRPEIIDALALARALFNPHDRVAWLGVLRAPWCGLSLADLHALTSTSPELLARPVPQILSERAHLLSPEGRVAVDRVVSAVEFAGRLRAAQPAATTGTWLEQVWLRLGGAQCTSAVARANLDLLWRTLDNLPQGEPDLQGAALDAALGKLTALPDPGATSDCGVQLMTIHKAKGLEFEVVIVPDLQALPGHGKPDMLSWLERGIPPEVATTEPEDSREATEFLIAPFSPKGSDAGKAKKWVESQRSARERQESRRLLYVAATRARDELHLFARPSCKTVNGTPSELVAPRESLLRTGWPAWQAEIQSQFDEFRRRTTAAAVPFTLESLAATGAGNARETSSGAGRPTLLRRLPSGFAAPSPALSTPAGDEPLLGAGRLYERHEGGLLSRALGKAVHALFQQLAQLLVSQSRESALAALSLQQPRIAASIRAAGIEPATAARIATQALAMVRKAAGDPLAQWILASHADAANEVRWTGIVAGSLRTVQIDRLFRAGPAPQTTSAHSDGETWWIIDYKTAHEDGLDPTAALPGLRKLFAPQVEAYAKVLRNLYGAGSMIRGGLYYPRMAALDWWEL
jgi:ATP-dependent helicase/nuclease subunit A